jgi:hypothetical protein
MVLVLGEVRAGEGVQTGLEDYVVAHSCRLSGGLYLGVDLDDGLAALSLLFCALA